MTLKKRLIKEQRVLLAIVIVVIVAAVSAINPRFIQMKNLITIFQQISVTGILTMAMRLAEESIFLSEISWYCQVW